MYLRNNDFFYTFTDEILDKWNKYTKEQMIGYSLAHKKLMDCLNTEERQQIHSKKLLNPIDQNLQQWKEYSDQLKSIQRKIFRIIRQYQIELDYEMIDKEKELIREEIWILQQNINEIESMINLIFEDLIAIDAINPSINELYKIKVEWEKLLKTVKSYSPK